MQSSHPQELLHPARNNRVLVLDRFHSLPVQKKRDENERMSPKWVRVDPNNRFAAVMNVGRHHQKRAISASSEHDISPVDERLVKIIAMY